MLKTMSTILYVGSEGAAPRETLDELEEPSSPSPSPSPPPPLLPLPPLQPDVDVTAPWHAPLGCEMVV